MEGSGGRYSVYVNFSFVSGSTVSACINIDWGGFRGVIVCTDCSFLLRQPVFCINCILRYSKMFFFSLTPTKYSPSLTSHRHHAISFERAPFLHRPKLLLERREPFQTCKLKVNEAVFSIFSFLFQLLHIPINLHKFPLQKPRLPTRNPDRKITRQLHIINMCI